tara:strand:+ start:758 stop:886 length:129 start_codon:yes stop_codon:yes gene_type:complete
MFNRECGGMMLCRVGCVVGNGKPDSGILYRAYITTASIRDNV